MDQCINSILSMTWKCFAYDYLWLIIKKNQTVGKKFNISHKNYMLKIFSTFWKNISKIYFVIMIENLHLFAYLKTILNTMKQF